MYEMMLADLKIVFLDFMFSSTLGNSTNYYNRVICRSSQAHNVRLPFSSITFRFMLVVMLIRINSMCECELALHRSGPRRHLTSYYVMLHPGLAAE